MSQIQLYKRRRFVPKRWAEKLFPLLARWGVLSVVLLWFLYKTDEVKELVIQRGPAA
jgi:hypothetical protein